MECVGVDYKKSSPRMVVDPVLLAFEARYLFAFKASVIGRFILLSRQVKFPLHYWCYTALVPHTGYGREVKRELISKQSRMYSASSLMRGHPPAPPHHECTSGRRPNGAEDA